MRSCLTDDFQLLRLLRLLKGLRLSRLSGLLGFLEFLREDTIKKRNFCTLFERECAKMAEYDKNIGEKPRASQSPTKAPQRVIVWSGTSTPPHKENSTQAKIEPYTAKNNHRYCQRFRSETKEKPPKWGLVLF